VREGIEVAVQELGKTQKALSLGHLLHGTVWTGSITCPGLPQVEEN